MAYSYVCEAHVGPAASAAAAPRPVLHFAPHASQTALYFPVLVARAADMDVPRPLAIGSVKAGVVASARPSLSFSRNRRQSASGMVAPVGLKAAHTR